MHRPHHFLLMHGAGLGGWIWDQVIPELDVPAEAIDLPGRGEGETPGTVTLRQCVEFVAGELKPRTVLVGHSISAEVALGVAATHPRDVAAVVLVSGMVPESGKSFMSLLPFPQRVFLHVLLRLNRNGITLPRSLVEKEYCNDLDEVNTERVLERLVPEAPRLYLDRLQWSAIPGHMPRFYVKLLNDRSVTLKQQDEFISRVEPNSVESLHTGHLPMLARPRDLAASLNRIVREI